MLRALDDDPLTELASIFPALPRTRTARRERRGEGAERYRLHYAIRSVLERLTERQPMVLALDDVHWADAASVEMLTHLLAPVPRAAADGGRLPPGADASARRARGSARGGRRGRTRAWRR